jgi:vaccinia related kinase
METIIMKYLIDHLAPRLSQRFNLELNDVVQEISAMALIKPPPITARRERASKAPMALYENLKIKSTSTPVVQRSSYAFLTVEQMKTLARERKLIIPNRIKKTELNKILGEYDVLASKVELPDEALPLTVFNKIVNLYCNSKKNASVNDDEKLASGQDVQQIKSFQDFTNKTIFGFNNPTKHWYIGEKQGSGGFGVIYDVSCQSTSSKLEAKVIKIEKKQPGVSLFMEINVYREMKKMKARNILEMIDSGMYKHVQDSVHEDYYFMIIPKCDFSLKQHIEIEKNKMTITEINKLLTDIITALEYIHSCYLHLDIKPANIMYLNNNWYLIDLGLAKKYKREEESIFDKKYAGNGTASYMSIHAHDGCMNRRCDLESLIYILFETLSIELAWRTKPILRKNEIKEAKIKMLTLFNTFSIPSNFIHFIGSILAIKPGQDIDYQYLKKQILGK